MNSVSCRSILMESFEILTHPDSRLRNKALPVNSVGDDEKQIAKRMLKTMYASKGIGLAAIQVNIQKRIIVIDITDEMSDPYFLFNPEIIKKEGKIEYQEGCLSIPGVYETVSRYEKIRYQYLDMKGQKKIDDAEGLMAICIQHEIDHLDGKLFVDYLSILKQRRIEKKSKKAKML